MDKEQELKNLIDHYCNGVEPTMEQERDILAKVEQWHLDLDDTIAYIEYRKKHPINLVEEEAKRKAKAEAERKAKQEAEAKRKAKEEAERKKRKAIAEEKHEANKNRLKLFLIVIFILVILDIIAQQKFFGDIIPYDVCKQIWPSYLYLALADVATIIAIVNLFFDDVRIDIFTIILISICTVVFFQCAVGLILALYAICFFLL